MPARLSCLSSNWNPKGSTRCSSVLVAAHNRATLPVLGGISGSTRTMRMGFVKYFPQHESMGRGGHPCGTAVAGSKHFRNIILGEFTASKLDKRADDATTH